MNGKKKGVLNMRYTFTGKNSVLSDAVKNHVEKKLSRLEKFLKEDSEVFVTVNSVKLEQKIEVTIPLPTRVLRGEVSNDDLYAAIDEMADILEGQLVKYRTRLRAKSRREPNFKDEFAQMFNEESSSDDKVLNIERTKRFAIKPMDAEEAVMEMELLGHEFFVFRNGQTDETNVVYRRKNGSYGLIEPEF